MLVADHIEEWGNAYHGTEEIRTLRHGCPDEKAGVRSAEDRKLRRRRYLFPTEPLGGTQKIVERRLPVTSTSGFVPRLTELSTTADVRNCEDRATLQHECDEDGELGCHRHTEASIAGHDHRDR